MKKIAIAVLLSAFFTTPVLAAESYIGIGAGQNKVDISGAKESTAFSVFGGYSFNEYIAGELSYVNFGSADTSVAGITLKGSVASISAVGSLPLSKAFSLFARLGYATSSIEATGGSSQSKSDLTYGVGAQFNAARNIGVRLGYDSYKVGDPTSKDSNLMSVSVLFKF